MLHFTPLHHYRLLDGPGTPNPTDLPISPEGGRDPSEVPVVSVIGGVAGALVIAFLIAAVWWKCRRQRQSAGDYEKNNSLPTTGEAILSTCFKTTPVPRAPVNCSEISSDAPVLPSAPSVLSPGVKVSRKVEKTLDGQTALVSVRRERKMDAKEEDVESANEGNIAELLHERGNTFSQTRIQGPRKTSTSSLRKRWSSKISAAVDDESAKNHALMDALEVVLGSAHAVASRTSVPLVAEIAGFLGMLAKLSKDVDDNVSGMPKTVQWCRSMLEILEGSHLRNEVGNDCLTL